MVLADNGQEALDVLARDAAFDGVLMDIQMPVMDGFTATRAIRQNLSWQHLPVIAMTANAMSGDRERVLEAGMVDYIAKPLNVAQMFATIARWIRPAVAKSPQSLTPPSAAPEAASSPTATPRAIPVDTVPADLAGLPGIDVPAGLATVMGNVPLYRRLLRRFLDGQADFAEHFAAAQQEADLQTATRFAHTLKGVAGNLGARGVQAAAQALEAACHEGQPPEALKALLAQLESELAPVLEGLRHAQCDAAVPMADRSGPIDPGPHGPALQALRRLLSEGDTEAIDQLQVLLARVGSGPLAAPLQAIAKSLADCDFDAALARLQVLHLGG